MFIAPIAATTVEVANAPVAQACYNGTCGGYNQQQIWVPGPQGRPPVLEDAWKVQDGWCWQFRQGYEGLNWYFTPPNYGPQDVYGNQYTVY